MPIRGWKPNNWMCGTYNTTFACASTHPIFNQLGTLYDKEKIVNLVIIDHNNSKAPKTKHASKLKNCVTVWTDKSTKNLSFKDSDDKQSLMSYSTPRLSFTSNIFSCFFEYGVPGRPIYRHMILVAHIRANVTRKHDISFLEVLYKLNAWSVHFVYSTNSGQREFWED